MSENVRPHRQDLAGDALLLHCLDAAFYGLDQFRKKGSNLKAVIKMQRA
jgi:hypothetical protein